MSLVNELIKGLLPEEEKKKVVAVYGGGFKPPTSGHFAVVKQALKENPEIDEFIILIGGKPRNGITPDESILIWDIYKTYLPFKVEVKYTSVPPIKGIYNYAKEHPDEEVLFVIGAREGNEEDFKDIASRTTTLDKYPNLNLRTIVTQGGVSGTAARNASKISLDKFKPFVPTELSDEEIEQVYNIVADKITENITEGKQVGTLYHYTSADGLKGILQSNSIRASKEYYLGNDIYFVSFTRNKNFHKKGSAFDVKMDYRITLDGDKLSNKYKIKPFAYIPGWNYKDNWEYEWLDDEPESVVRDFFQGTGDYDEQEERISFKKPGGSITNIKDYILKVDKVSELTEGRNENASYSQHIDVQDKIAQLTQHMIDKGMNVEPLPSMEFIDGDSENAKDFFGKTAYYDPNRQHIVLYTEGRHPKDIVRSYAHEMIHHIQYLEDRLGDVSGTNTMEDDHLDKIEQEANLRGTMTFRNWTDSILNENVSASSFPNSALLFGGFFTGIQRMGIGKTIISDLFKSNPKLDNLLLYTQDDAVGFWKKLGGKIIQQGEDKKGILRYFIQINRNDVDPNLNLKQLGISYKNLSTKKSKIDKGEYAIKMGKQKIGFFFVRDIGTIQMDPMSIFADNLNESKEINNSIMVNENTNFKPLVDKYKKLLNLQDWKITLQPIKKNQVQYSDDVPEKDRYYIGVERDNSSKTATIYYDRDLTDEDVLHELLHLKLPDFDEDNINALTDKILKKNSFPDLKVNESIVGEKIKCDNCSWSWNIVDGGDDLFICHKCGHDNKPINEKKNKDPFGLNAYAMELGRLNEKESEYKVYLDMDGVLADFDQRFRDISGMEPREYENKYGRKAFWDLIDEENKIKFWVGIPVMDGAAALVDAVKDYDYELLTSPSAKKQSYLGKILWVKNHIGSVFPSKPRINFKRAKEKHEVKSQLSQTDILIDDREDTIGRWNAAGGTGIVYKSIGQVLNDLKKLDL